MTIIERMARAICEAENIGTRRDPKFRLSDAAWHEVWRAPEVRMPYERAARAALRAVRAEDISDAMCAAAVASLRADGFNRPMNEHKVRRAIAAAIAAGGAE